MNKLNRTLTRRPVVLLPVIIVCLYLFFMVLTPRDDITDIHQIQGDGPLSPLVGEVHTIEGVVVGDFLGAHRLDGFFVQEEDDEVDADSRTSEGLFVYAPQGPDVDTGDLVRVTGEVTEYYGCTQLYRIRRVTIIKRGVPLPAAIPLCLPFASDSALECYEGMRVSLPQTLSVTDTYYLGQYGSVTLSSGERLRIPTHAAPPGSAASAFLLANTLNRLILDDGSRATSPDPVPYPAPGLSAAHTLRVGDTVDTVTGVLHYSFDQYRLHPTSHPRFDAVNPRPAAPAPVGGTLKVAGFNLHNYFTTLASGNNEARGATSLRELNRQQEKILATITALDADILGLMEIENAPDSALDHLVAELYQRPENGRYASIATGKIGSDAIRVGLLYKPESVTPVGPYMLDTSRVFTRPPLAQVFEDVSGERFTIVVNHFKSKICTAASGADADQGDGQACYNHTRLKQAGALLEFIDTVVIPAGSDPDVLILGDLNAYVQEDPIRLIKEAGYINLIDRFVGEQAYSYVFDGQSGYLEHALATESLTAQVTGVGIWHINADEPRALDYVEEGKSPEQLRTLYQPDPYRSSDHDPVLIGLRLRSDHSL